MERFNGGALFFRAYNYFDLAQGWCKEYNKQTASTDLGLPLKLRVDVTEKITRASVQQTYDQIITDLTEAKKILPVKVAFKTQPSKAAASALLARIYLAMENYELAYAEANTALQVINTLLDYNTLNPAAAIPFSALLLNNPEIIFYCATATWAPINNANLKVAPTLYGSYATDDLRRTILYQNNGATNGISFKGYYSGLSSIHFSGLATNELYLIRSESAARIGKLSFALEDINSLLSKRWNNNSTYIPFSTVDGGQALIKILEERRKELPFTANLRWSDLRRLNKDSRFAITLTRNLNDKAYTLPPNDKRYVLPIPEIEVKLSGIQQNER